jgi:L-ascorbate metabolism protein UlaG (beta-lactamase superfamily)
MELGDEYVYPHGRIVAVAADHPGGRFSLDSEPDGRALGFVIEMPWAVVYYSGDTDYFEGFAALGESFAPDLVLLNINAHLKPEDAIPAIEDLGSPLVVPMHYGAYNSINELRSARWHDELEEGIGPLLIRLPVGESVGLEGVRARRAEIRGESP